MSRSQSGSSPRISPADQAREDRREVFASAVECFQCHDELEERAARQVLYLVIRRVRQAYRDQSSGSTRSELKDDLLTIQNAILELEEALQKDETQKALKIVGARAQQLNPKLGRLKGLTGEAIQKLNLAGRLGSDRAAHSFTFHARPLLVVYMKRLYAAVTGEEPNCKDGRDNKYHDLLALTWEFATHKPSDSGWERHIGAADRNFVLLELDGSMDSQISLSGQGPGTPQVFLNAYVDAGDLARIFNAAVSRRRSARTPITPGAQLA